ncbi:7-carboxy-7-deazaguanine synthase [Planctomycetes bacterium Poly30]|uniref:7-carboxy-7-deazaguanine synthase n=1 Tax=Saltatorellus ferox TaxID=2528018 RepID=A0A518EVW1_9BACT|nr:7-carboxy-7-deazaguanine synthase [Planctomycetes bacterium Poly30]
MPQTPSRIVAPVVEVFASFQGEGSFVGEAQVFLRLAGCPLRCLWCDTPGSWAMRPDKAARIQRDGEPVQREDRVASPFQAALWIAAVEPGEPRTVSITGGEPLMWPDFIRALRPMLGNRRMHLETAGAHPESLARVLDVIDHVSLDLKLPSDMAEPVELERVVLTPREGEAADADRPEEAEEAEDPEEADVLAPTTETAPRTREDWAMARRRCLDLIQDHDACVKVVVSGGKPPREYDELFEDVARRAPNCPVFIAPATPIGGVRAPEFQDLVTVVENARDLGLDVRVLPQVHRMLGIA